MASYAKVAPEDEREEAHQLVPSDEPELPTQRGSLCCLSFDWFGIKALILGAVVIQNTAYALVRRYSRGSLRETYSTSSVLLVMELAKMLLSALQIVYSDTPSDVPAGSAWSKYVYLVRHSLTMLVPAAIYLAMNILGFLSLKYIDAATFAIIAQMKVFTTAIFSVVILNRRLHLRKWRALLTLTLGVVLISHEAMPKAVGKDGDAKMRLAYVEYLFGLAASFGDVALSGFVSIYFEKVLKSKTETYSVWDRNFQLAFWSIIIYTPIMLYDNPRRPFQGWTAMAGVCAFVGGVGGVLVALSIKYADSIMKTIATTGAIVFTTILNAAFLDGPFTLPIMAGAVIVMVSVCNYNDKGDPESS